MASKESSNNNSNYQYKGKNDKPDKYTPYTPGQPQRNSIKLIDAEEHEIQAIDFSRIGMNTIHPKDRVIINEAKGCDIKKVLGEIDKYKQLTTQKLFSHEWQSIAIENDTTVFPNISGTEAYYDQSINFFGATFVFDLIYNAFKAKNPEPKFLAISDFEITADIVGGNSTDKLFFPVIPSFMQVKTLYGMSDDTEPGDDFSKRIITTVTGKIITMFKGTSSSDGVQSSANAADNYGMIKNLMNNKEQSCIVTERLFSAGLIPYPSNTNINMGKYDHYGEKQEDITNILITDPDDEEALALIESCGISNSAIPYSVNGFQIEIPSADNFKVKIRMRAIPLGAFVVEDLKTSVDAQGIYNGSQNFCILPYEVELFEDDGTTSIQLVSSPIEYSLYKLYLPMLAALRNSETSPTNTSLETIKEDLFSTLYYKRLFEEDGYYITAFCGYNGARNTIFLGFTQDPNQIYIPLNSQTLIEYDYDTYGFYPEVELVSIKRLDDETDYRKAEYLVSINLVYVDSITSEEARVSYTLVLSRATAACVSPVIYTQCGNLKDFIIVENALCEIDEETLGIKDVTVNNIIIDRDNTIGTEKYDLSVQEADEPFLLEIETTEINHIENMAVLRISSGGAEDQGVLYDQNYESADTSNVATETNDDIVGENKGLDRTASYNRRNFLVNLFGSIGGYAIKLTKTLGLSNSYGRQACRFIPAMVTNAHTEKFAAVSEYLTTEVIPIIYPITYLLTSTDRYLGFGESRGGTSGDTSYSRFFRDKVTSWFSGEALQIYYDVIRTWSNVYDLHKKLFSNEIDEDGNSKFNISSFGSNCYEGISDTHIATQESVCYYRPFVGSLLLISTQKLNPVGTPENVLFTNGVLNCSFINSKIIYGINKLVYNRKEAITDNGALYLSSSIYNMSSDNKSKIADFTMSQYKVFYTVGQFIFASDDMNTYVYMLDDNGLYCIGKSRGVCVYKPGINELGLIFTTLDNGNVYSYLIEQSKISAVKNIEDGNIVQAYQIFVEGIGDIIFILKPYHIIYEELNVLCTTDGVAEPWILGVPNPQSFITEELEEEVKQVTISGGELLGDIVCTLVDSPYITWKDSAEETYHTDPITIIESGSLASMTIDIKFTAPAHDPGTTYPILAAINCLTDLIFGQLSYTLYIYQTVIESPAVFPSDYLLWRLEEWFNSQSYLSLTGQMVESWESIYPSYLFTRKSTAYGGTTYMTEDEARPTAIAGLIASSYVVEFGKPAPRDSIDERYRIKNLTGAVTPSSSNINLGFTNAVIFEITEPFSVGSICGTCQGMMLTCLYGAYVTSQYCFMIKVMAGYVNSDWTIDYTKLRIQTIASGGSSPTVTNSWVALPGSVNIYDIGMCILVAVYDATAHTLKLYLGTSTSISLLATFTGITIFNPSGNMWASLGMSTAPTPQNPISTYLHDPMFGYQADNDAWKITLTLTQIKEVFKYYRQKYPDHFLYDESTL